MPRDRAADALRPLRFDPHPPSQAAGAVLASMGRTCVLCTCCIEPSVPEFLMGTGKGWLTAEYNMLPGSTGTRKPRDRGGKVDGRSVEIQRLIGRALRSVVDLKQLGERTLWIDCDVLQADGGTRTTAINGAYLALVAALRKEAGLSLRSVLRDSVAAVSVGLVNGNVLLDLDYEEDRVAAVDLNLVMTGSGRFVEVQAGGEEATFAHDELATMLEVGKRGILEIRAAQQALILQQGSLD
jgi:ribonuclease PH